MDLSPTIATDPGFVPDAALYAADRLTLEQLTALHGGDMDAVLKRLADPATVNAIEARVVQDGQSGADAKAAAHALLRRALKHLDGALDNADLGASTVVRIADLAHRVTGIAQPTRDVPADYQPRFSVNIIMGRRLGKAGRRLDRPDCQIP